MTEKEKPSEEPILNANDLAFERTILAENRTLMAWIRTAISLISFGFTMYKFFAQTITTSHHGILSAREVGMMMIVMGELALIWGLMEHKAIIKKLKRSYPQLENSRTRFLALLILGFGIVLLAFAYLKE